MQKFAPSGSLEPQFVQNLMSDTSERRGVRHEPPVACALRAVGRGVVFPTVALLMGLRAHEGASARRR
jgi:hypothetical protein